MQKCNCRRCKNKVANNKVYCSMSCRTRTTNLLYKDYNKTGLSIHNKTAVPYDANPKKCIECGKDIPYGKRRNRFCNASCAATHTNLNRVWSDEIKNKIRTKIHSYNELLNRNIPKIAICNECNTEFVPKWRRQKYCSRKCGSAFRKLSYSDASSAKEYKRMCGFKFYSKQYPHKFDLDLVIKHGWYHPNTNPIGVSRDHMFSIIDGYKQHIDPSILRHPANCQLLQHTNNRAKGTKSSIELAELIERIANWK